MLIISSLNQQYIIFTKGSRSPLPSCLFVKCQLFSPLTKAQYHCRNIACKKPRPLASSESLEFGFMRVNNQCGYVSNQTWNTVCGELHVNFTSRYKQRTEQWWCSETEVDRDKVTARFYIATGSENVTVPKQDNHYKMFIVAMSLCCSIYYRQGFSFDIFDQTLYKMFK